jgi:hypothetical protein
VAKPKVLTDEGIKRFPEGKYLPLTREVSPKVTEEEKNCQTKTGG